MKKKKISIDEQGRIFIPKSIDFELDPTLFNLSISNNGKSFEVEEGNELYFTSKDKRCLILKKDKAVVGFAGKGLTKYVVPDEVNAIRAGTFCRANIETLVLPNNVKKFDINSILYSKTLKQIVAYPLLAETIDYTLSTHFLKSLWEGRYVIPEIVSYDFDKKNLEK